MEDEVCGVQFGILSENIINDLGTCIVENSNCSGDGSKSLTDPRMGPSQKFLECRTCGKDASECHGHFGVVHLARPVVNIMFMGILGKILNMFCFECSKMKSELPDRVWKARRGGQRFKMASKHLREVKRCRLGHRTFRVKCCKKTGVVKVETGAEWSELPPHRVARILDSISATSKADLERIGLVTVFGNIGSMMARNMLVLPPCSRPPHSYGSKTSSHFFTRSYRRILKANKDLREMLCKSGACSAAVDSTHSQMSSYIWSIYDSAKYGKKRGNSCDDGVKGIISGKHGRFRENLLGKRVDYTARSVITPDVNIEIDEFGVPEDLADGLARVVRVNRYNAHLPEMRGSPIGSEVVVPLKDGDWVVVNRQPTLQCQNVLGMRVRILQGLSFRLNPRMCGVYGADFDGDQMNVLATNMEPSKAEVSGLMSVENNLGSNKGFGLCSGAVQDEVLCACKLSSLDCFLEAAEFCNAAEAMGAGDAPQPAILKPRRLWTGKQLLSLAFPKDFYYAKRKSAPPEGIPAPILVIRGELACGWLTSKELGGCEGSIPHAIWTRYGGRRAMEYCRSTQRAAYHMCELEPHSLQPRDFQIDQSELTDVRSELSEFPGRYRGRRAFPRLEALDSGSIQRLMGAAKDSQLMDMVSSGSKGNAVNLKSILHSVGQQREGAGPVERSRSGYSLPHYAPSDELPESRGFVVNSFASGLTEREYFFVSRTGRLGLVNKHINTMSSGHVQRKLSFGLQDLRVCYDGTVRDGARNVVQFVYGGDMARASHMRHVSREGAETSFVDPGNLLWEASERYRSDGAGGTTDAEARRFSVGVGKELVGVAVSAWGPVGEFVAGFAGWFAELLLSGLLERSVPVRSLSWVKGEIVRLYELAMVEPGEMVGMLAAQSISEPCTQMALDSPHDVGGVFGVLQRTSRMSQIIGATKKTTNRVVTFSLSGTIGDWIAASTFRSGIWRVEFDFKDMREFVDFPSIVAFADAIPGVKQSSVGFCGDAALFEATSEAISAVRKTPLANVPGVLAPGRLVQRSAESVSGGITVIEDIHIPNVITTVVEEDRDDLALYYETHPGLPSGARRAVRVATEKTDPILRRAIARAITGMAGVVAIECRQCVRAMYKSASDDEKIEELRRSVARIRVSGIKDASRAWQEEARGVFSYKVMGPSVSSVAVLPMVDFSSVRTSDLAEVASVWGIEACRFSILSELEATMQGGVETRHLELLADVLTRGGTHCGFTASGLSSSGSGVIKSLCFEKPFDRLVTACAFGEVERFEDVCSQMVFGKVPKIGTHSFDVMVDLESLPDDPVEATPHHSGHESGRGPSDTERESCWRWRSPYTPQHTGPAQVDPGEDCWFAPESPEHFPTEDEEFAPKSPRQSYLDSEEFAHEFPVSGACIGDHGKNRQSSLSDLKCTICRSFGPMRLRDGEYSTAQEMQSIALKVLKIRKITPFDMLIGYMIKYSAEHDKNVTRDRSEAVAREVVNHLRSTGRIAPAGIGKIKLSS